MLNGVMSKMSKIFSIYLLFDNIIVLPTDVTGILLLICLVWNINQQTLETYKVVWSR